MPLQSRYNVILPLERDASAEYFVLFNTLAGSIDVIDRFVVEALREFDRAGAALVPLRLKLKDERVHESRLSTAVVDYLDARGYLYENLDEERVQSRVLYNEMLKFHRDVVRQPLAVIPSYNCDLKCSYCWQRLYDMDSPVMSEEMAEHLFEVMPEIIHRSEGQQADLAVFGGEPLQDIPELRDRVVQILELSRNAEISPKIITNGVGLKAAAKHIAGKVESVQVTMDGPENLHRVRRPLPGGNSFTALVEGVTVALEHGIRIHVRVNADQKNLPELPALADFVQELGWLDTGLIDFHVAPVKNHNPRLNTNSESQLLKDLLKTVEEDDRMSIYDLKGFPGIKYFEGFKETGLFSLHRFFNCEAQINFYAFDLHGDVYACWDAAGIKKLAVGRFHPGADLDHSRLNTWRARTSLDITGCEACTSQPHCGGGCQFISLEHSGSFFASSCDSMMEGYSISAAKNSDWLLERARSGDHAVGLVTQEGVVTPVTREWGLLDDGHEFNQPINCG